MEKNEKKKKRARKRTNHTPSTTGKAHTPSGDASIMEISHHCRWVCVPPWGFGQSRLRKSVPRRCGVLILRVMFYGTYCWAIGSAIALSFRFAFCSKSVKVSCQGVCRQSGWVGFLVCWFLYEIDPNPRKKLFALGKKWPKCHFLT